MKKLFESVNIFKDVVAKNRFVRSATWLELAGENGELTEELYNAFKELAEGGVGTIGAGYAYVLKEDQPAPKMIGMHDDSVIEGYKKLTDMVHENGTKIYLQLVAGGSHTGYRVEEREVWGPSAVTFDMTGVTPVEMTKENIAEVVKAFGDAARRTKKAGFDGIEIHAAHCFLLSQFLSPYYNRRTDEYGGDLKARTRILVEVYNSIREAVGPDFPVMMKINSREDVEGGFDNEQCLEVCKIMEELGLDAIEVSGFPPLLMKIFKPEDEAYFGEFAARLAKEVEIPVWLVGGNRSFENLEEILNKTDIACFSLSRPLLREPDLINRWKSGDLAKAKCISCNQCYVVEGYRHCVFR